MEIYQPEEDSYLLAKYVEKYVKKGNKVLDVGCGSGIQSETALKKTKDVLGVDINPNAIKHCKSSEYTKGAKFQKSNLFSNVKGKFNIIIFNPPYLPDAKDPKEIKAYTTGGKHGYEIIDKFLQEANNHLADDGIILIVFSNLTKKRKVDEIIENYLFESKLLEEKSLFYEKLYCYKIKKSGLLKKFNKNKIKNPSYLAKGKRGMVFKGVYKGKQCVVKIHLPKSKAFCTIDKEARWMKYMNNLKIGPKLYHADKEMVISEYIDGTLILDYFESNTKQKIKKVILIVLDQMHLLDKKGVEKKEMCRPYKHIIVRKDKPILIDAKKSKISGISKTDEPVLIDFERTRPTEKPQNVTQFLQFIVGPLKLNQNKIITLSKKYKQDYDIKEIKKYLYDI